MLYEKGYSDRKLGQISHFSPPVKFTGGMGEKSELIFRTRHRTHPVILTGDASRCGKLKAQ